MSQKSKNWSCRAPGGPLRFVQSPHAIGKEKAMRAYFDALNPKTWSINEADEELWTAEPIQESDIPDTMTSHVPSRFIRINRGETASAGA
jgi:hypothetical protein